MPGKIEGKRRSKLQRVRWLGGVNDSMNLNLSKLWEIMEDRRDGHAAFHGVTKTWT